jgi:hypothetical protein
MKFKIPFLKNFSFFLLFTLIIVSCNEDFNTVGYDLISTNDFETNKVKLPVYSYQNEFLTDVQVDGLTFQQLGEIDIPNIGRSSAYIASQLSFIPTDFFGLYTPEDELGDEDNEKAMEDMEEDYRKTEVLSAELEVELQRSEERKSELADMLQRHNLTRLTLKKPVLIENRINDGTKKTFNDIESITNR